MRVAAVASVLTSLAIGAFAGPAAGAPRETPFAITTPPTGAMDLFADAATSPGGFVATWTRADVGGKGNSVRIREYDRTGRAAGPEVVVAAGPSTLGGFSRVVSLGGNRMLVTWRDMITLYGAVYDVGTNKVGPKRAIAYSNEQLTDLVTLANGNVAVVTSGYKPGTTSYHVTLTILSKTNLAVLRGPTPVHDTSYFGFNTIGQDYAVARVGNGGVVVRMDRVDGQVYVRRFAANGTFVGKERRINTTVNQSGSLFERIYRNVEAVRLTSGKVFVAWASLEGNAFIDGLEIRGRYLDANGVPTGPEIHVNTDAKGRQTKPELVALAGGAVLAGWATERIDGTQETQVRKFAATGKGGPVRTLDSNADGAIGLRSDFSLLGDGSVANVFSGPSAVMAEGIPAKQL